MLPDVTGCYQIVPDSTRCQRMLPDVTGEYQMYRMFTECYGGSKSRASRREGAGASAGARFVFRRSNHRIDAPVPHRRSSGRVRSVRFPSCLGGRAPQEKLQLPLQL
eukprot:8629480-Pyramimonas_sp.AAC.1